MANAGPTPKKRSFDSAFKLKVVEFAEKNSNRGAGRKFGVDEKRVREWRKQKPQLESLQRKKRRMDGGGRKAALPDLEEELLAWIDALRATNLRVTRSSVQRKAIELAQSRGNEEFLASRGWMERFFKRNSLSLRRRTTVSQRLPQDLIPKVTNFIMKTRRLCHSKDYPLSYIGNMDETPLWLDMPGETTVTRTGARSIPIRTTGHDKGRFTVVLAAMADGRKLKPFVVFKGVRPVAELMRVQGVVVALSRNGWMNEELTKDWVDRVWGSLNFGRRLLVWDAYKCHIMESIKSHVHNHTNSDISVIPGGLTSHLQPADVSWNKPFKEAYKAKYNEWMVSGEKSYTAAGNVRAPDKALYLQWVKQAWESVTTDIVKKSFRACGISVSVDGSEDHEIHCLKDGGVAADARPAISEATSQLASENDSSSDIKDPFASADEDEGELEQNELVLDDDC